MKQLVGFFALAAVISIGDAGCGSAPAAPTNTPPPTPAGPCGTAAGPAAIQHVIWIWMENRDDTEVVGAPAAPYANKLAGLCGLATNYNGIDHPSLPNYIAAVSGSTQGITDNNPPSAHPLNVPNLYDQVKSAGLQWRDYEESAPGNCPSDSSGQYAVRHDPAPYFTNIATDCRNWDVPMGTTSGGNFLNDLNAGALPAFALVTPNVCNDTHDCPVDAGDQWLASWMPMILASPNYKAGTTAIFVVWDEGNLGNHVPGLVVSPYTPVGSVSAARFDHYSLLRTTEELLHLPTLLANANQAGSMVPVFLKGK